MPKILKRTCGTSSFTSRPISALRASRMMLWGLVGLVVLGGMLEVIQGMVGRDADIHDEIANALGVLVGGLLGWGIVALHAKLVARRPRD